MHRSVQLAVETMAKLDEPHPIRVGVPHRKFIGESNPSPAGKRKDGGQVYPKIIILRVSPIITRYVAPFEYLSYFERPSWSLELRYRFDWLCPKERPIQGK